MGSFTFAIRRQPRRDGPCPPQDGQRAMGSAAPGPRASQERASQDTASQDTVIPRGNYKYSILWYAIPRHAISGLPRGSQDCRSQDTTGYLKRGYLRIRSVSQDTPSWDAPSWDTMSQDGPRYPSTPHPEMVQGIPGRGGAVPDGYLSRATGTAVHNGIQLRGASVPSLGPLSCSV